VADLLRLRVRAAPEPRPAGTKPKSGPPSRRGVLLHVHADDDERIVYAIASELLDGSPVAIVIVPSVEDANIAESWAMTRTMTMPAGVVVPAIVTAAQLGRFIARRCWDRRAGLDAFDLPWTLGRLAADVRRAKNGGLSVALAGCGWPNGLSGRWMDSHFRPRLRVAARGGEDGGAFLSYIPPRQRRKTRRRLGGPFVDMKILGDALGADASSPKALARSYGLAWPGRSVALDQLLDESLALVECYRLMLFELYEVAPGLAPERCWSAGSIITHALQQAGVRPPVETTATLPSWAIGGPASAFHGGRTEALLVGQVI
jgi:hypothetical protein